MTIVYSQSEDIMATCNAEGTGALPMSFSCSAMFGTRCNPATGECFFCVPGAAFCQDTDIMAVCNADGTAALPASFSCSAMFGSDCNADTGMCRDCTPGASCGGTTDCCAGFECRDSTCQVACGTAGDYCPPGSCCAPGYLCKPEWNGDYGRCCADTGASCETDEGCCGYRDCVASLCACVPPGGPCLEPSECCPNLFGLQECVREHSWGAGQCCGGEGSRCESTSDCCSLSHVRLTCNGVGICAPRP